jgi:hypothetical protein
MKPPLSPAHGTSLGTTAGITAVITVVAALSVLGQIGNRSGVAGALAAGALIALLLGAGALYEGRNEIGRALDLAPGDAKASAVAAARGLFRFHLGMAGVFAGGGFAVASRIATQGRAAVWLVPAAALGAAAVALVRAVSWAREAARREGA